MKYLNKEQITSHFVGRSAEIDIFMHWLQDPKAPWILYFHDAIREKEKKGGVGKSWLLKQCLAISKEIHPSITTVAIDFSNIANRDGFVLVKTVVEKLKSTYPNWFPKSFIKAVEQHSIIEHHNITAPESQNVVDFLVRDKLFTALAADLQDLHRDLADENKSLLIFLDTFELIEENPTVAVLGPSQKFPDNYQFEQIGVIIAGRNPPDWSHPNWQEREHEVQCVPVRPFTLAETVQFLNENCGVVKKSLQLQSSQAIALHRRTGGQPILLGLTSDVLNHDIMTLKDLAVADQTNFEALLVLQVNKLENPINWIILFMAHVYHRFNAHIMQKLLENVNLLVTQIDFDQLFDTLSKTSFIKQTDANENIVLHDEMRRLVVKYCWGVQDSFLRFRRDISNTIIDYYEKEIKQANNEQERQIYIIEQLYHQLFLDLNKGLHYFQHHFQWAIRLWNAPFARSLFLETKKFEKNMSLVQQSELRWAQAELQSVEENAAAARLVIYEGLAKLRGIELRQNKVDPQRKPPETVKIFYSYAEEDKALVAQLQTHLAVLKQNNLITEWHKGLIMPGEDITNQIKHLNTSHIILFCISPSFIASEDLNVEITYAMARHKTKEALIIPVLLRPTGNWKDAPFGNFQTLPRNSKAVTSWNNRDEAFDEIAQELKGVIHQFKLTDF